MLLSSTFDMSGRSLHAGLAAAQLFLFVVAYHQRGRDIWLVCLGIIAALALVAWIMAMRRLRVINGTPTSRIGSAAQGYVELRGAGLPLDVNPLRSPLSGIDCLWYCYRVERRNNDNDWELVEQAKSDTCFVLDDGSDSCMVDPQGAEIVTRHCRRWNDGQYRYVEWTLQARDPIYVLGNFLTLHAGQGLDARADTSALLAEWKQDKKALLRRFDLNHNGEIDADEWELARRLASRTIEARHRELLGQPGLHLVRDAPEALFLISNHDPEQLTRRFRIWALVQLAIFLAALGWSAWWWRQG